MPDSTFWIPVVVVVFAVGMSFATFKEYKQKKFHWGWLTLIILEIVLFGAVLYPVWVVQMARKN